MKSGILVALLFILSSHAFATDSIIEDGFKAFKEGGANKAWPAWAKGGPLEGSKELMAQASQFGTIGAYYGNYVDHDYVGEKKLGPKNKVVYVIMNMDSGPLYGIFTLYKSPAGNWTAPNFMFHTQIQQIWPASMFSISSE